MLEKPELHDIIKDLSTICSNTITQSIKRISESTLKHDVLGNVARDLTKHLFRLWLCGKVGQSYEYYSAEENQNQKLQDFSAEILSLLSGQSVQNITELSNKSLIQEKLELGNINKSKQNIIIKENSILDAVLTKWKDEESCLKQNVAFRNLSE